MRERHRTNIELIMKEALEKANINAVEQFPIRGRFGYILDFAIVDKKIDIECDGEVWHKPNNDRDRKRNWVLRNRGWKILRFSGTEITKDINACIDKIKQF